MKSYLSHLECSKRCHDDSLHLNPDVLHNLCKKCGAPLLVRYHLDDVRANWGKPSLLSRVNSLWRYFEVLPVRDPMNVVSLGEGMTPMWKADRFGGSIAIPNLWVKDEGIIPTGTFKARGASVGVSRAKELGVTTIALPTNGNAGAAWGAYSARAGIKLVAAMPLDAPPLAVEEMIAYGTTSFMVNGQITDAGTAVKAALLRHPDDWFDASTLKEPYRIEGKKTMGYEIAEQFGWQVPDVILYPTGGGVGLIGIFKAFEELVEIGWIEKGKLPKMVAVQAEGCAPIVKAFKEGKMESVIEKNAQTIAQGIRVPKALGDFIVLDICRRSGGTCIAVDDALTSEMLRSVALMEGSFICPEGAAAFGAAKVLRDQGWIKEDDKVVILNTGTGFKYPGFFSEKLPVLEIGQELPL